MHYSTYYATFMLLSHKLQKMHMVGIGICRDSPRHVSSRQSSSAYTYLYFRCPTVGSCLGIYTYMLTVSYIAVITTYSCRNSQLYVMFTSDVMPSADLKPTQAEPNRSGPSLLCLSLVLRTGLAQLFPSRLGLAWVGLLLKTHLLLGYSKNKTFIRLLENKTFISLLENITFIRLLENKTFYFLVT